MINATNKMPSQTTIFEIKAKETISTGIRNIISKWNLPWCLFLLMGSRLYRASQFRKIAKKYCYFTS